MTEINPKVKAALISINFIQRYQKLADTYNVERTPSSKRLVYVDKDEVIEIIRRLGYTSKFNLKEKFYKTEDEIIGHFRFREHIILRDGNVQIVWVVYEGEELLLGSPWGTYPKRIDELTNKIKMPVMGSYEDLEEILKVSFEMYRDFKLELIYEFEKRGKYYEWDEEVFDLPDEYCLSENADLADVLNIFYKVGGYDFFHVVNAEYYASNWLNFIGNLYSSIVEGKYASCGKRFVVPLNAAQRQELVSRNVPEVFITDIN